MRFWFTSQAPLDWQLRYGGHCSFLATLCTWCRQVYWTDYLALHLLLLLCPLTLRQPLFLGSATHDIRRQKQPLFKVLTGARGRNWALDRSDSNLTAANLGTRPLSGFRRLWPFRARDVRLDTLAFGSTPSPQP